MKLKIKEARNIFYALAAIKKANSSVSYPILRNASVLQQEVRVYESLSEKEKKRYEDQSLNLDLIKLKPEDMPPNIPKLDLVTGEVVYADFVLGPILTDAEPESKLEKIVNKRKNGKV